MGNEIGFGLNLVPSSILLIIFMSQRSQRGATFSIREDRLSGQVLSQSCSGCAILLGLWGNYVDRAASNHGYHGEVFEMSADLMPISENNTNIFWTVQLHDAQSASLQVTQWLKFW